MYKNHYAQGTENRFTYQTKLGGFNAPAGPITASMMRKACDAAKSTGVYKSIEDTQSLKDIRDGTTFDATKLQANVKAQLCSSEIVTPDASVAIGLRVFYRIYEDIVDRNGYQNLGYSISGGNCALNINVSGTSKGDSYSKRFSCTLNSVVKNNNRFVTETMSCRD